QSIEPRCFGGMISQQELESTPSRHESAGEEKMIVVSELTFAPEEESEALPSLWSRVMHEGVAIDQVNDERPLNPPSVLMKSDR
ncbi:MAG: hypothetical protein ACR2NZ_06965, partial [Rubripirellula sp.]